MRQLRGQQTGSLPVSLDGVHVNGFSPCMVQWDFFFFLSNNAVIRQPPPESIGWNFILYTNVISPYKNLPDSSTVLAAYYYTTLFLTVYSTQNANFLYARNTWISYYISRIYPRMLCTQPDHPFLVWTRHHNVQDFFFFSLFFNS